MRKFFKKIHVLVLSFVLSISNVILINQANASTAMGGWSLSNPVSKGASVLYNGAKNVLINGKNVVKTSTALITPVAKDVSKLLVKGGGGVALSFAIEQLFGSVDWVLDPANNQINYTEKKVPATEDPTVQFLFTGSYNVTHAIKLASPDAVCSYLMTDRLFQDGNTFTGTYTVRSNGFAGNLPLYTCLFPIKAGGIYDVTVQTSANPIYDPTAVPEDKPKSIALDTVASKIISNAESGNSDAQVVTTAVAADIVNDAQNDSTKARPIVNQLEANAETKTEEEATGQSKPNTETGGTDLSLTFPVFCGWAPVVCEAAQVVISFPSQVGVWVTDLLGVGQKVEENTKAASESTQAIEKELTKEDGIPEKDKTDINLPDLPINPEKVNVNWGGSCPTPTTTSISFHGQSREITILRYDFICEWSWVIKASVIALASIGAVFIISGRKT